MFRIVIGVVIAYIVIAAIVFIGLTLGYQALGSEGAFKPGVWDQSAAWLALAVIVNLIAAFVGGVVCVRISRSFQAALIFAILVFLLGVLSAIPYLTAAAETAARPEGITMFEAMRHARAPMWFALANPVTACAGVLLGASLMRGRLRRSASEPARAHGA